MSPAPPHKDYSGTPLTRKLGIVSAKGHVAELAILGEPVSFRESLGESSKALGVHAHVRNSTNLALCFVPSRAELSAMLDLLTAQLPPAAHVWLIHPKAHNKPDFNQNHLRDAALAIGLVDYKVCSIDDDWSGLKFAWRNIEK